MTRREILKEIWKEIPMKARYSVFFILGMMISSIGFLVGCSSWKADCLIEEVAEQIIEAKLGLPEGSLDLTPFSPES